MRIDALRLFDALKAYEKSDLERSRPRGGDRNSFLPVRDEVILSTEAKRVQIRDRVVRQVVERLRNLPPSHNPIPEVDAVLEEAVRDIGPTPVDPEEKARIRERSLEDLRRGRGSR
jgi:hypothetical protein